MTVTPPPAPPQYSPDGRFWWDGIAWQPVPSNPPASTQAGPVAPMKKPIRPAVLVAILVVLLGVGGATYFEVHHNNQENCNRDQARANLLGTEAPSC